VSGGGGPWAERRRLAPFADLEAALGGGRSPVLDLGCGRGFWLRRIASAGLQVVGVEPDPARARMAGAVAPVVVAAGANLPLADASVGTVWCLHVLHHLDEPAAVLAEVRRVLRPDGRLLLAESVEDNPAIRLARTLWPSWEGVPVRARFSAAELAGMVAGAGLRTVELRQHTPLSFLGLVPPRGGEPIWSALRGVERAARGRLDRWGAYVDCVARPDTG
jgi:SAM-dependent methyltransferase